MRLLERHEQREILEPGGIRGHERLKRGALRLSAYGTRNGADTGFHAGGYRGKREGDAA